MRKTPVYVPPEEMERQAGIMDAVRGAHEGGRCHVITYGCQMNAHDSEKLLGMLSRMGYEASDEREEADVIIFNTCCIRDNAERRALGNVSALKRWKAERPGRMIGVCGCMTQQPGAAESLLKKNPFVDFVFGSHNFHEFPEIFRRAMLGESVCAVEQGDGVIAEGVPVSRQGRRQAYVTIMYGCDNFCSYCIVPYVRGRQRSRSPQAVLSEIRALAEEGVLEVTLLGQNVNSYGLDGGAEIGFPALLEQAALTGAARLRFMTSHPKDCSPELIEVMARHENIAPHIHLPVQSGSDRVLAAMNRRYTAEAYLSLVSRAREAMPNIGITSDVIVGFPGETEEDFGHTLELVNRAAFDGLYTFEYSPRTGTPAASLGNQVPDGEKTGRLLRLLEAQKPHSAAALQAQVGKRVEVLFVEKSARDENAACGRTARGMTVNAPGCAGLIDTMATVEITQAKQGSLVGKYVPENGRM